MRFNRVFSFWGGMALLMTSPGIGTAQPTELWNALADSLYDGLIPIDAEVMTAAENSFLEAHERGDCTAQIRAGLVVLRGVAKGTSSRIFPAFLEEIESCDAAHSPRWNLFKGNAFYSYNDWNKAAEAYRMTRTQVAPEDDLFYYASFNLSSVLNNSDELEAAIEVLESLIEAKNPLVQLNEAYVQLNLAAMQLSAHQYNSAKQTMESIERSNLSPEFNEIFIWNELILGQQIGNKAASDSVWTEYARKIDFPSIPIGGYNAVLRSCLSTNDLVYYAKWHDFLSETFPNQETYLSQIVGAYVPFIRNFNPQQALKEPFDGEEMTVWNNYVHWEREHQAFLAAFESRETSKLNDAILALEKTIAQERLEKQGLQRLNWAGAITALILCMAFLIYRIQVQKKRIAFMERAMNNPVLPSTVAIPLKNEDLRTLTEAITKGTRISDASLVIRKLQVLLNQGEESESISVTKKARFNELNESEKAVVDYLANGFEAKEIARVMKVSTAYVYNVRSRIRIKLNIPEEMNLNSWLRDVASGKDV